MSGCIWEGKPVKRVKAISCAQIAVDEIIEAIDWHEFEAPDTFYFWHQVKEELDSM